MDKWLKKKQAKQVILRQALGLQSFGVNPSTINGQPGGSVRGFWVRAQGEEAVQEVSAPEYEATEFGQAGGTIVFGLGGMEKDQPEFAAKVESYVADLVHEAMGEALGTNVGWTIGTLGYGRYVSPTGETFDERSTTVSIKGIDSQKLQQAAEALAQQLNQQAVIVIDDNQNKTYMLGRK